MTDLACAILIRGATLLLGRRSLYRGACPGLWDLIGGHVEVGETPRQALVREVLEEVAVTPTSVEPVCVLTERYAEAGVELRHHLFAITAWQGGEPRIANDEHSELRWFDVEAACARPDLALPQYRTVFRSLHRFMSDGTA